MKSGYIDYKDTNVSYTSLDSALVGCIGIKYEGGNGGTSMEITKNAIENMLMGYVDHKKIMKEYENEQDEFELEGNPEYMFHRGCCETSE